VSKERGVSIGKYAPPSVDLILGGKYEKEEEKRRK
jgi:hypothetical protein